ncbi:hypothetical protein NECAME_03881 [Necator americanus]|uniref:DNA topoisomerase n=1 Tax=Necator americanus TaxID=51031 RepID=W2T143_NECAM|nr:hypothetical protein NECAME_03881 [Necator americanus]ETN74966.1 hypothetical protein NECAME_03881 [Necator americanus]
MVRSRIELWHNNDTRQAEPFINDDVIYFITLPSIGTETNKFPPDINLESLVNKLITSSQWGDFANEVLQHGPNPRNGNKSDEAHPPIHPLKLVTE